MTMNLKTIAQTMETAVSGGYVHLTNYVSDKGEVSTVLAHLIPNYGAGKEKAIKSLREAIAANDFQPITVTGKCYNDNGVWNSRKKSAPLKDYSIEYSKEEVKAAAEEILADWIAPKEKVNNEIALTEKGKRGLVLNLETGRIQFDVLVEKEIYNVALSEQTKDNLGILEKTEVTMPISKLKAEIRNRFQKKFKTYILEKGKFESISVNGIKFTSDEIQF
jgi:hypothetical protein